MPLEQIGRYRIIGELGKGAMGVVYRAEDPTIGRTVALKTTRVDVQGLESDELLRRFRLEARAAGVLNHPNIVTIYDAGEQDGLFYIAMELIEGVTLQSLLAERGMVPTEQAIDIGRQICTGLDFAHARGVVHRDVKPANVMITPEGGVKIMDFGIAKSGGGMTTAGQVLGTPSYMSPEQVKGQPLDGRSDLFSVGVILYEAVTGLKPFAGDSVTAIIYKIVHEEPLPAREVDLSVHPGLSAVITRALAKSPAQRYQRGADLAADLMNYKSLAAESTLQSPARASMEADTTVAMRAESAAAAQAATAGSGRTTAVAAAGPLAQQTAEVRRLAAQRTGFAMVAAAALVIASGILVWSRYVHGDGRTAAASSSAPAPVAQVAAAPGTAAATAPVVTAQPQPNGRAPAVAARTAPTTGELRLNSSPAGVKVQIDGRTDPRWTTPFTIARLAPGWHRVTFIKDGYGAETRSAEVTAGRAARINAVLSPLTATLSLGSTPAGADILVDGKESGKTTPAQFPIPQGAHSVLLRKAGFQPAETTVNLQAGENYSFAPQLRPAGKDKPLGVLKHIFGGDPSARTALEVRTQPKGAEVLIDGTPLPRKTPTHTPVQPGTYRLTIRMDGFKTVEKTVTVKKGEPLKVEELLQRQ